MVVLCGIAIDDNDDANRGSPRSRAFGSLGPCSVFATTACRNVLGPLPQSAVAIRDSKSRIPRKLTQSAVAIRDSKSRIPRSSVFHILHTRFSPLKAFEKSDN